jgi:hypothetical protein
MPIIHELFFFSLRGDIVQCSTDLAVHYNVTLFTLDYHTCIPSSTNCRAPFRRKFPRYTILGKLLLSGSQLGLMQQEIVHAADTQDAHTWKSGADAMHQRTARVTKVVCHGLVLARGL